jgi:hypothetical protein
MGYMYDITNVLLDYFLIHVNFEQCVGLLSGTEGVEVKVK